MSSNNFENVITIEWLPTTGFVANVNLELFNKFTHAELAEMYYLVSAILHNIQKKSDENGKEAN